MVSKTTFKIRLNDLADTKGLSQSDKDDIKDRLAEFVIDKILSDVSKLKSPVDNSPFPALTNKKYKKMKREIAPAVPNLELHGDMLDALKSENYQGGVEIGIFDYDQAQKSDNHNKFSANSRKTNVPKRQFIPLKGESLRPGIMRDVVKLAKELIGEKQNEN